MNRMHMNERKQDLAATRLDGFPDLASVYGKKDSTTATAPTPDFHEVMGISYVFSRRLKTRGASTLSGAWVVAELLGLEPRLTDYQPHHGELVSNTVMKASSRMGVLSAEKESKLETRYPRHSELGVLLEPYRDSLGRTAKILHAPGNCLEADRVQVQEQLESIIAQWQNRPNP